MNELFEENYMLLGKYAIDVETLKKADAYYMSELIQSKAKENNELERLINAIPNPEVYGVERGFISGVYITSEWQKPSTNSNLVLENCKLHSSYTPESIPTLLEGEVYVNVEGYGSYWKDLRGQPSSLLEIVCGDFMVTSVSFHVSDLYAHWQDIVEDGDLIAKGSTRDVYALNNGLVKKVHRHYVGYLQSIKELETYTNAPDYVKKHLNPIISVNRHYQICKYQLSISDPNYACDFDVYEDDESMPYNMYTDKDDTSNTWAFSERESEVLDWLESQDILTRELLNTGNSGVSEQGDLIFIDYGMSSTTIRLFFIGQDLGQIPSYYEYHCQSCDTDTRHIKLHNEGLVCCICDTLATN